MATKKDNELRGGLSALFGNRAEDITPTPEPTTAHQPEAEATAANVVAPEPTAAPTEGKPDLIDQVTDEELKAALHKRRMLKRGRPRKGTESPNSSLLYTRVTSIVSRDKMELIREISYRESLQIKEVLEAALDLAISAYEAKHGKLLPTERPKGDPETLFK